MTQLSDFKKLALIGQTGFVGGNLQRQLSFTHYYNSKNFGELKDQSFDLVVCSGISAVKWWANRNPVEDWKKISELLNVLQTVKTNRFVLISTIDIYPNPVAVNEDVNPVGLENHAYGRHRLEAELLVQKFFRDCSHIIRLPGLFGHGLKKNVIFDLMNNNCLDVINPNSSFQYYFLSQLGKDIRVALEHHIPILNLSTEPIKTSQIIERFFPKAVVGKNPNLEAQYDMQTKYSSLWGKTSAYQYSRDEVLNQLGIFLGA